jgi:hypothetical protein
VEEKTRECGRFGAFRREAAANQLLKRPNLEAGVLSEGVLRVAMSRTIIEGDGDMIAEESWQSTHIGINAGVEFTSMSTELRDSSHVHRLSLLPVRARKNTY